MTAPVNTQTNSFNAFVNRQRDVQNVEVTRQNDNGVIQVSSSSVRRQESVIVTISGPADNGVELPRPVEGPGANQRPSPEDAANNILQFVARRLAEFQAEGASIETLRAKLEEAREGFERGVAQSRDILSRFGELDDAQEQRIDRVISRFNEGIEAIANNLPGNNDDSFGDQVSDTTTAQITGSGDNTSANAPPNNSGATNTASSTDNAPQRSPASAPSTTTSTPSTSNDDAEDNSTPAQFINSFQRSRIAFSRQESIDLQLRTQDGDSVTIRFFASQGGVAGSRSASFNLGDGNSLNFSREFSRTFGNTELQIEVLGDIDDDELAALEDLLSQLGDVANAFFSGQDSEALSQALSLEIDAAEIAQFSVDLQSREVLRVTERYREVAAINNDGTGRRGRGLGLGLLLQQIRDNAIERAEFSFEKQFVEQLLSISFAAASTGQGDEPNSEQDDSDNGSDAIANALTTNALTDSLLPAQQSGDIEVLV